ncbi:phosphinothricin acetyltransferase [Bradyrhizobium sp. Gha]|nr:GNAT family N-acetyltransferase [Bradyrhizobium sp. Gha]SFK27304.1 phosphinothricin acetyltransferase [Bradyrhizobium sp. Gha]
MSYQVRPLRADDLPSVTEIYNAACRAKESTQGTRARSIKEMRHFIFEESPSFESYTCVDEGAVVGWTALTRFRLSEDVRHTAEMSLYVQKSFRQKGIGSHLAHTLLSRARILKLHCISAFVFKDMPTSVSFAERKCGLSAVGYLPEVFSYGGRYYDVLILEKLIEP